MVSHVAGATSVCSRRRGAPCMVSERHNLAYKETMKLFDRLPVDAPLNPYVLEFLGLSPLPQPAGGAVAYEPLVVQGVAAPTAASTATRATSAEHRAAMHRCARLPLPPCLCWPGLTLAAQALQIFGCFA